LAALFLLVALSSWADETNSLQETNALKAQNPPLVRRTNSFDSLFQIKKGFRIEPATLERLVASPVAMAFDERGRLFVAEMRDYPEQREQIPHGGRVVVLEDSDGDGVFDSNHVYAENLPWPSALACYDGGVFVAAAPEIIYFKDTASNGSADVKKVYYTGFGAAPGNPSPNALLNNFTWGLDNRIHAGTAGMGGVITAVETPGNAPMVLGQNDFSFDPKTSVMSLDGGAAHTGLCFDDRGRKYVSDSTHPLQLSMFDLRYFARNPFAPKPQSLIDVIMPGTPVFRYANLSSGPGQRIPLPPDRATTGWMSKARSPLIYRGSAFPSDYVGNAFICDPELHVIHRSILVENGLRVAGQRARDELGSEFLQARDPLFRPSQLVTGPDGAIYVADMQNGGESGRILRIVPDNLKSQKLPQLSRTKTYDLVAALAHRNSWQRETATRLLYEQRDPAAVGLLTNMINNSRLGHVRMRALCALDGLGGLKEGVLLKALRDSDESVREHAVALSEQVVRNGKVSDAVWSHISGLAADPSIRVQYQLAFTLGNIELNQRTRVLADILGRNLANPWFQAAALSSLSKGASDMLIALASQPRWRTDLTGQTFMNELALNLGLNGQMNEVSMVLDYIIRSRLDQLTAFSLLYSLGEGLHRIGSSLALVDPQGRLQTFYDQALDIALGDNLKDPVRLAALRLRSVSYNTATYPGDIYQLLFGTGQSEGVQTTALMTLGRYENPAIASNVIARWPELTPNVRRQAISALLQRTERVIEVVAALQDRRISPKDLSLTQINFLRTYRDQAVSQRAAAIFSPFSPIRPGLSEQFKSSLSVSGNPGRGLQIFRARCTSCHRLGGEGTSLGPDLAAAKIMGKEKLLTSILEPSREIMPAYAMTVVETKRRENLMGILTDDNGITITLRQSAGGAQVWPRSNVQAIEPQPWSLMPDGLEQGLNVQSMADLLDYILAVPQ
jgi:putative membrane-bound dehydrogenase-like protein